MIDVPETTMARMEAAEAACMYDPCRARDETPNPPIRQSTIEHDPLMDKWCATTYQATLARAEYETFKAQADALWRQIEDRANAE